MIITKFMFIRYYKYYLWSFTLKHFIFFTYYLIEKTIFNLNNFLNHFRKTLYTVSFYHLIEKSKF